MLIKIEGIDAVYDRISQVGRLGSSAREPIEFPIHFSGHPLSLPEPLARVGITISLLSPKLYSAEVDLLAYDPSCFRGLSSETSNFHKGFKETSPDLVGYLFSDVSKEPDISIVPYGERMEGRALIIGSAGASLRQLSSVDSLMDGLSDLERLANHVTSLCLTKKPASAKNSLDGKELVLTCI